MNRISTLVFVLFCSTLVAETGPAKAFLEAGAKIPANLELVKTAFNKTELKNLPKKKLKRIAKSPLKFEDVAEKVTMEFTALKSGKIRMTQKFEDSPEHDFTIDGTVKGTKVTFDSDRDIVYIDKSEDAKKARLLDGDPKDDGKNLLLLARKFTDDIPDNAIVEATNFAYEFTKGQVRFSTELRNKDGKVIVTLKMVFGAPEI